MDKILHASKCGFPCRRNLFYAVNSLDTQSVSSRTQRIFDVGTALEPVIVDWLRSDGWTVDYNQGSQNAPVEIQIELTGGSLIGHHDCIISKPEGPHNVLADIKTMNERAFSLWKREGSIKNKPQYVKQIHVYALGLRKLGFNIEKLCIIGVNKNNSDIHFDFFDFEQSIADDICSMAENIFALNQPPLEGSPNEEWCCSYCEFNLSCELFNKQAPKFETSDDPDSTHDEALIQAFSDLFAARNIAKHAKELEDSAKSVINAHFSAQNVTSLKGGGFICYLTEKKSSRFDSSAFKKAHPDLAQEFIKDSVSVNYNVKEL